MKRNNARMDSICQAHLLANVALSGGGTAAISVAPAGLGVYGTRVVSFSDTFNLFRINKLRFRISPSTAAVRSAGFIAGTLDTAPTTPAQVMESPWATFLDVQETKKTEWVNVPTSILRAQANWYKSVPGTPDAWDEQPGALYFTGPASGTVYIEIDVEYEFRDQVAPADTPMIRAQKAQQRERARILSILATPDCVSPGTTGQVKQVPSNKLG